MTEPVADRRPPGHSVGDLPRAAAPRLPLRRRHRARALPGRLGISHLYCSPFLRARPGSQHGYDVVDHGQINPELGTREDFDRLVEALHAHGMGLHGRHRAQPHGRARRRQRLVAGRAGERPASAYAEHFDIDWQSADPALAGRCCCPCWATSTASCSSAASCSWPRRAPRLASRCATTSTGCPSTRPATAAAAARAAALQDGGPAARRERAHPPGRGLAELPPREAADPARASAAARQEPLKARLALLARWRRRCSAALAGDGVALNGARRRRQLRRARRADRRAGLPPGALARGRRRDQLPALLRHQRAGRAAHGARPRCSRPRTGWCSSWPPTAPSTACASTIPTAWPIRPATSAAAAALRRGAGCRRRRRGAKGSSPTRRCTWWPRRSSRRTSRCRDWALHGTTGYRFANVVNGLLVEPRQARLDRVWRVFAATRPRTSTPCLALPAHRDGRQPGRRA
jgi:(1->4)-alpha-D-glucan 1-alpha-D-glucosylmutase